MRGYSSSFRLVSILAIVFAVAGCSPSPPAPLRVGLNAWPGYELIYLAQEKGYYRDEGVNVRIVEFNSLSDARRAFERGQLDAFATTVVEVLQARDQSARSPQVVQVVDYSDGADVILARPGINNGNALRGKRIGVELASVGVYILARGLAKNGLALTDVITISMDQTSMEEAFRKGDLDAVVTYPPASIKLLRDNAAHAVFSTAEIPGEVIDVLAVDHAVNVKRAADVKRLVRAFHRAIRYTTENPDDAHRIMAAREGITAEEFRISMTDGLHIVAAAEQAEFFKPGGKLEQVIEHSDRILRDTGQIKGSVRRADVANTAFVDAAK